MANFLVLAATSCILLAASVPPASSMPAVYSVGDEKGWRMPSGNGTESYNQWAKRNRFQVGDILDFKYANDSVLLVNHDEYKQCSTESPASRFTDGDTKFKFERAGPFYFISGAPDHCEAAQRMMVHVVVHSTLAAAAPAKPPAPSAAVVHGPGTPSYGSSSGSMDSASPSPLGELSGAYRRAPAAAAGFSVVTTLLVGVVTMRALA